MLEPPREGRLDPQIKDKLVPPRIAKESIRAVVRTADLLIVGQLHARPEKRLKDELNLTSERYIAVTDARVYDAGGTRLLYETGFLLVSHEHIVSVAPLDVVSAPPDAAWARP